LIGIQGQALLAHTCNLIYSGGRDQEDHSLKPAWASSSQDPILEKPITKIGLLEWLKMKVLSSSPSTTERKKKAGIQIAGKLEK
jgi:hypothetical protein